jgi:predicted molibdopterin-dependent oxidoreductase YjgC
MVDGSVNLTINGQKIKAQSGQTILQAARQAGIHIPVLCDHPALPPEGACRICLVEIERQRSLQPACTFPATEGLVIHTHSPKVMEARKFSLELLISDHPLDCMTCEATGACLLQDLAYEYGIKGDRYHGKQHQYPIDDPNPFIQVDRNKCILCRRCVRACTNINGVEAISVFYRGFDAYISFGADTSMAESPCEFCGSCVAVCPTAALWPKISIGAGRPWQTRRVKTTCSYCGVGCQLELVVKDNRIVGVESDWDGPSNHGWTCVKGRFGWDYVHHADRLTKPKVRRYLLEGTEKPFGVLKEADEALNSRQPDGALKRSQRAAQKDSQRAEDALAHSLPAQEVVIPTDPAWEWVETDWETALDITASKLRQVRDSSGPDAVGFLTSAKCLNEENYLMNKLARQVIGTNNIDHCARL